MNELQRQAYMEAMGVDCYIPRLHLPAALPSVLCEIPELAEVPVAKTVANEAAAPVTSTPKGKNGSAAAMQALLDDDAPIKEASPQSVKTVTETLVQDTSANPIPHFSLSIVRGGNVLIVDDGLPGHVNPSEYLQLLHNILFALGAGKQQLAIDSFVWPMVKNSKIDQSETAARQTLDAFLSKQVDQLKAQYIIVMGEAAASYISSEALATGTLHTHPQWKLPLICTNSASPMLSDPSLKRAVWNDLQPLLSLIKSG